MKVYYRRFARPGLALLLIFAPGAGGCADDETSVPEGTDDAGADTGEPADAGATDAVAFYDACRPGSKPDEDCYVEKRDPSSERVALALEIAQRYMDEHPADDRQELSWDWAEGVLMMSLVELHRITGDTSLRDYYRTWIDAHIEAGYSIVWSDSCPPAVTALALYQENGDEKYRKVIDDVMAYLEDESLPTEDGAFSHLGQLTDTVWVDSLFMFGVILTRWGEVTDDKAFLDTLGEQFAVFGELLQDQSGLFRHTHAWPLSTETDIFWARGNGWATAAGFEYLRARRLRGESDPEVEAIMSEQVRALLQVQDQASGLWWDILNRPGEIYLETSASALIAYGMARGYRYGYLDEEVLPAIETAMGGVESKVVRDEAGRPLVTDISGQTTAGDYDDYAAIPLEQDMDFGVGAVILALIETSGLVD